MEREGMGRNAEPAFGALAEARAARRYMALMRRLRVAMVLLCGWAMPAAAGAQVAAAPPLDQLLERLQAHYDRIADFSADFEHRYAGGVLRTSASELGTLYVSKPGLWRFEYASPESKLFICDGMTIHSYFPADRQVIVTPLPMSAGASTPAALLAGEGDLRRDFAARYVAARSPDRVWSIELTPVRNDAAYESLTLAIDPGTLDIVEMATTDFQGGVSTYVLSNVRRNQGLPDTLFVFDVPAGVEVIADDSFVR